jgi:hypothetical protein
MNTKLAATTVSCIHVDLLLPRSRWKMEQLTNSKHVQDVIRIKFKKEHLVGFIIEHPVFISVAEQRAVTDSCQIKQRPLIH